MNNENEIRKTEKIRSQYIEKENTKMDNLKKLDNKVKAPGKVISCILGVIGVLVMGAGMSLIMVENNMQTGLILGIPGMIVALLAYPVYSLITNHRKKKYKDEIIRLSEEITL